MLLKFDDEEYIANYVISNAGDNEPAEQYTMISKNFKEFLKMEYEHINTVKEYVKKSHFFVCVPRIKAEELSELNNCDSSIYYDHISDILDDRTELVQFLHDSRELFETPPFSISTEFLASENPIYQMIVSRFMHIWSTLCTVIGDSDKVFPTLKDLIIIEDESLVNILQLEEDLKPLYWIEMFDVLTAGRNATSYCSEILGL